MRLDQWQTLSVRLVSPTNHLQAPLHPSSMPTFKQPSLFRSLLVWGIICAVTVCSCTSQKYAAHQYRRGHQRNKAASIFKKHNHPYWQRFDRISPID
jgi:hypothetical protein